MIRLLFKLIKFAVKLAVLAAVIAVGINVFMVRSAQDAIVVDYDGSEESLTAEGIGALRSIDPQCILVLGASVNPDGTPSPMLRDRLDTAIALYKEDVAPKLLLSGDDGQLEYNEVVVMRQYALEAGVKEKDIFLDHAGFSTYESVYRAGEIFGVERMVVVTQEYHLSRALYGCRAMEIVALGAAAGQEDYVGQESRDAREALARCKDCIMWLIEPEPTYLGEAVPISGSGISTH